MDFKALGSNLGLDEDEFMELVELFVRTADDDIKKIKTAWEHGDANKVAEAAHSLKGSSGNLGFLNMSEAARDAEIKGKANDMNNLEHLTSSLGQLLSEIKACVLQ